MSRHLVTSESVTEGHPDKVADQISDAVLDVALEGDANARVACEALVTTGLVLVAGEITAARAFDISPLVRDTLRAIGYTDAVHGIDAESCGVLVALNRQSSDIARGVEVGGAGDQGMMFGYAVDETPELMPLPITLAHRLTHRFTELRRNGTFPWARPDGKAQVTVEYDGARPLRVDTVVVSVQHSEEAALEQLHDEVIEHVILPVMPDDLFDQERCTLHINPTGRFVIGGPRGDTGLTGRKVIVDTYGGVGRHGGGAFSGKDASKVDRSAAYGARWAAKNVVAAGLARRCEVELAYAIGVAEPVSVHVDTAGTGQLPDDRIAAALREVFDFRPLALIEALHLRAPIFCPTAAYGHFGRAPRSEEDDGRVRHFFSWEKVDRSAELRSAAERQ